MRINIPYGTKGISFELPDENIWQVLFPYLEKPIDDISTALLNSLDAPGGTHPLPEILQQRGSRKDSRVVIITDDETHPTPQKKILDILIPYLQNHGVLLSNVQIVIATGVHRPLNRDEIHTRFGKWMAPISIENHSTHKDHTAIGRSFQGEDISLNRTICSADVRIAGGSQLLVPGAASLDTIADYYRLYSANPTIVPGQYFNTLRGFSDMAAEFLKIDFAVNIVLNATEGICHISSGNSKDSFLKAANLSYRMSKVRIRPGADVVIAGSYPSEHDLWQMFGTFINLAPIVRDGGIMVLVSPCQEGTGSHPSLPEFVGKTVNEITSLLNSCDKADIPAAAVALRVRQELQRIRLCLVSDCICGDIADKMGVKAFSTIEEAVSFCKRSNGTGMKTAIVPYGGKIFPYFETEQDLKDPNRTRWL